MKKVVILIIVSCILFCGCSVKKTDELTDAEKFAKEYSISDDNPFQYASVDDVLELFQKKSSILFLGDSDCEWSTFGAKVLNKALKKEKISKVYYFNPEHVKNKKSKKYKKLIKLLDYDKDSTLPIVYIISDGRIVDQVDYVITENATIDKDSAEKLEIRYSDMISQYI